ncbi:gene transfer agent host specificity protein [Xanthomonas phage vB_XciM_LucasX]|nr:gene transfer agent host specificity protein [Xanthomonas phage vB_XciM_LucasX]
MSQIPSDVLQYLLDELNERQGLALTKADVTLSSPAAYAGGVRNTEVRLTAATNSGAALTVLIHYTRLDLEVLFDELSLTFEDFGATSTHGLLQTLGDLRGVTLDPAEFIDSPIERPEDADTLLVTLQPRPGSLTFTGSLPVTLNLFPSNTVPLASLIDPVSPKLIATAGVSTTQELAAWLNTTYDLNIEVAEIQNEPLVSSYTEGYNHQVTLAAKAGSKFYTGDADVTYREGYQLIRGVTLIPSTGASAYSTVPQTRFQGSTSRGVENVNTNTGKTDVVVSLEQLSESLPLCETVSVVIAWFGDDQRAGVCTITPRLGVQGTENLTLRYEPDDWSVAGVTPANALKTSVVAGSNVYGSTPSDASIIQVIQHLKSLGKRVVFYPFLMMDIQSNNTKPNPYWDGYQSPNVWRGRVSCYPAPGVTIKGVSSPDGTAEAGNQIDTFFNSEWGFKRYINHYRDLCVQAGGVDAFLIGSEMIGITHVRSAANTFAAAAHLKELAAGVKAAMPNCKVSYAADWSEYHSKQYSNGDLKFPLDEVWADPNIDFIGIDNYLPIADCRADQDPALCHDIDYLKSHIEGGEYYDYYYIDRTAGTTGAITDGGGKPWVYRQKDIRGWWSNRHYPRNAYNETSTPTAWLAGSKPVWFTEFGCAAVDRGPNQPNVFLDPKSFESALPYFSTGEVDMLAQQAYITAMVEYWTEHGGAMISPENMIAWTWDARPFPQFPQLTTVWGDGGNYLGGHWVQGRLPDSIPVMTIAAGSDGVAGSPVNYTLTLDKPSLIDLIVNLGYGGTAVSGTDFTPRTTVTVPAGQTSFNFTIATIDTGFGEDVHTLRVSVVKGFGYKLGVPKDATLSITDKPWPEVPPVPSITLVGVGGNRNENAGTKQFTIVLSERTTIDLVVPIAYNTGAAVSSTYGDDYTGPATVTVPANTLQQNFNVSIVDDNIYEGNESARTTIQAGTGYTLGSTVSVVWTILDNDAKPTMTIAKLSDGTEGSTGPGFRLTANRLSKTATNVILAYSGTATAGTDYTAQTTVTLPAMANNVDFYLSVVDDMVNEGNETVIVTIQPDNAYTVGGMSSATATIIDRHINPKITIAAAAAQVTEGGTLNVRISADRAPTSDLTVQLQYGGTAVRGTDYTLSSSTPTAMVLPAGSTTLDFTITATADQLVEPEESIVITVVSASGYDVGDPASTTIRLLDNDGTPTVSIARSGQENVNEGDRVNFTVSTTKAWSTARQVNLTFAGTATKGTDYTLVNDYVTIPAGQTSVQAYVDIVDDTAVEADETIILGIATNAAYTVSSTNGSIQYTILNTDSYQRPVASITNLSSQSVDESRTEPLTMTVGIGSVQGTDTTVYIAYSGTATKGTDYTAPDSVVVPAGQISVTAQIQIINDTTYESSETIIINVQANAAYDIAGSQTPITITIVDDDGPTQATFSSSTYKAPTQTLSDSNRRTTANTDVAGFVLTDTVKRTGKYYVELTYMAQATTSSTSCAAGIVVGAPVNLTAYLGSHSNAYGTWAEGTGIDRRCSYNNASATNATTGNGAPAVGQVFRIAVDIDAGRVWLGRLGSSAWLGGGDPATNTSPTYTFTPNSVVRFGANPRGVDGSVSIRAYNAWVYAAPAGFGIWDNVSQENWPRVSTVNYGSVQEGNPMTFQLTLDKAAAADLPVNLSYGGTAVRGTDYTAPTSRTVTAGNLTQQWSINTVPDNSASTNKTLTVTVNPGPGYIVGSPATGSGTITNNAAENPFVNTVAPAVSGNTTPGSTLTVSNGTWTGGTITSYGYEWYRNGFLTAVKTQTYVIAANDDIDTEFFARVYAKSARQNVPAQSNTVKVTAPPASLPMTATFVGADNTDVTTHDSRLSYMGDVSPISLIIENNQMAPGNDVGGAQCVFFNNAKMTQGARSSKITIGGTDNSSFFLITLMTDGTMSRYIQWYGTSGFAAIYCRTGGEEMEVPSSAHYPTIVAGDVLELSINAANDQLTFKVNDVVAWTGAIPSNMVPVGEYSGAGYYSASPYEAARIVDITINGTLK